MPNAASFRTFGLAWLALCAALAIHIADEAANGFVGLFNQTSHAIAMSPPGLPMPTLSLHLFLILMVPIVLVLFALTPFAFQGRPWMRPLAVIHAVIEIANAGNHTLETILGHTVSPVHFPRPAPGFYSSPLLAAAAVWLMIEVRRTAKNDRAAL